MSQCGVQWTPPCQIGSEANQKCNIESLQSACRSIIDSSVLTKAAYFRMKFHSCLEFCFSECQVSNFHLFEKVLW